MDYRIETNATFYKALFMYMQQAGRRGCMRSAFELARMIFALDPHGDPVSVVLALDYYALASRQYAFILALLDANIQPVDRFTESARSEVESHSLSSLPNLYLSSALAMYDHELVVDTLSSIFIGFIPGRKRLKSNWPKLFSCIRASSAFFLMRVKSELRQVQ